MQYTYHLEIRSQKSRGSSEGRFGGPNTYVAVQVVPEGIKPLLALSAYAAEHRGIKIHYFGEGYSRSQTSNSMLGRALARAKAFIAEQTGEPYRENFDKFYAHQIAREKQRQEEIARSCEKCRAIEERRAQEAQ